MLDGLRVWHSLAAAGAAVAARKSKKQEWPFAGVSRCRVLGRSRACMCVCGRWTSAVFWLSSAVWGPSVAHKIEGKSCPLRVAENFLRLGAGSDFVENDQFSVT